MAYTQESLCALLKIREEQKFTKELIERTKINYSQVLKNLNTRPYPLNSIQYTHKKSNFLDAIQETEEEHSKKYVSDMNQLWRNEKDLICNSNKLQFYLEIYKNVLSNALKDICGNQTEEKGVFNLKLNDVIGFEKEHKKCELGEMKKEIDLTNGTEKSTIISSTLAYEPQIIDPSFSTSVKKHLEETEEQEKEEESLKQQKKEELQTTSCIQASSCLSFSLVVKAKLKSVSSTFKKSSNIKENISCTFTPPTHTRLSKLKAFLLKSFQQMKIVRKVKSLFTNCMHRT
ncbi:hypothetical protein HMI54_001675 [Coelomomyces lativittatus]|nr:hypothetical protein HMI56_006714 [Coelomomyces lativittatus]KAJ1510317.1 hypothetical protein HMI54_001675 [Coelomomyces lativittatus]KAJ1513141.1 hypothetical protein HMI55_005868 [Coelomomyces lativittatus]